MSKIQQALEKLYGQHRIIFWYDDKHELHEEFSSIELNGVTKVELPPSQ